MGVRVESVCVPVKFRPSKIKAIETKYNGYHFRSRLEARYAVFFDNLGIKYYYEHEGYSLEGIPYLPDFFLPEHDCFIEIKGVDPTEEELEKASLLAAYTGKPTYLFAGNICFPQENGSCWTYSYYSPTLWKYHASEYLGDSSTQEVRVSPELLGLLQRANELGIFIDIDNGKIAFSFSTDETWTVEDLPEYIENARQQHRFLATLQLALEDLKDNLIQALTPDKGWKIDFLSGGEDQGDVWVECEHCGEMIIGDRFISRHKNRKQHPAGFSDNSPRLLAAYEAARQARF